MNQVAQLLPRNYVQTDSRLVEEEELGRMQQAGRDFSAHALAERKLTHRGFQKWAEIESRDQ
jgi:hypothetical protein